ncbi:hypothetical protein ACFE04_028038 [Oxalis oulophora]
MSSPPIDSIEDFSGLVKVYDLPDSSSKALRRCGHNSTKCRQSSIHDLSDHVLIDILRRIDDCDEEEEYDKSIVRCKLVCKRWSALISLTQSLLNHPRIHRKLSHFVPQCPKSQLDQFPVFLAKDKVIRKSIGISKIDDVTVLSSCNDLLLCRLGDTHLCVCNPFTKHYAMLPRIPHQFRNVHPSFVVGFDCQSNYLSYTNNKRKNGGRRHVNDDDHINANYNFRVVLIYTCSLEEQDDGEEIDVLDAMPKGIQVREFSSNTNQWRDHLILDMPRQHRYLLRNPFESVIRMYFHKEMGFWHLSGPNSVGIYNPRNTTLSKFKNPGSPGLLVGSYILGVCQDSLRFFQLTDASRNDKVDIYATVYKLKANNFSNNIDIDSWAGGGEWSLLYNVSLHELGDIWHSGFRKYGPGKWDTIYTMSALAIDPNNPDIIYIRVGNDDAVVSCNLQKKEMKKIQAGPFEPWIYDVFPVMSQQYPTPMPFPAQQWPSPIR